MTFYNSLKSIWFAKHHNIKKADMPIDKKRYYVIRLYVSMFWYTPLENDVTLNWRCRVFRVTSISYTSTNAQLKTVKKSSQGD